MNGLALCAGVGGLELGLHLAVPGYRTVGYVERDAYAAAVLVARMEDQTLDPAPIWDDIATFDGGPWRGRVDLLSAGYPCQPFSDAGHRQGVEDPRHLWPHVARIVAQVDPEWCFLENVAGHLSLGFREVHDDLERMGYRVAAGLFSAEEMGAPHRRIRLFICAHRPDTGRIRLPKRPGLEAMARHNLWPTPRAGRHRRGWWTAEPGLGRVADGVASRMDRLRCIGNGVVPAVAAAAWAELSAAAAARPDHPGPEVTA